MKIILGYRSYVSRAKGVTGMRLVNMYAEENPEGSKYPFTLYSTGGLLEWLDIGNIKAIQGMAEMGGLLYVVTGNDVYKVDSDKNKTNIGSISGVENRVMMSSNGTQLSILNSEGAMWVATSSSVTQVSDADFPTASSVTFLDGYTIVSKESTGQFYISSLLNSTAWDALDFATAEERPDNLVRVFAFNGALWLLGQESIEVYYNSGNADFPFEQIQGAVNTTRGLGAKFSVAEEDNSFMFLGNDRIVYRVDGRTPVRVSDHALEAEFEDYTTISDAFAFFSTKDGHKYYNIIFPTENKSWSYDIATGFWHERTSLVGATPNRWRANAHEDFNDLDLIGDYANGKIYEISSTTYTEDGTTIERICQGAVQWADGRRAIHDRVRLDVVAGVGLITGQGSDPQVMMKYSDDGLRTFSNERWRSIGKIGEYKDRAIWRQNGQSRERVYEFRMTDPVPFTITGAYLDARVGLA